jgi:hypothetical protein
MSQGYWLVGVEQRKIATQRKNGKALTATIKTVVINRMANHSRAVVL